MNNSQQANKENTSRFLKIIITPEITDMQCELGFAVNKLLFMQTLFCNLLEKIGLWLLILQSQCRLLFEK